VSQRTGYWNWLRKTTCESPGHSSRKHSSPPLRAWAEARLDPRIPDSVVEAVDNYVADRRADADDFLLPLNDYLMARMPTGIGQPADPQDCSAEASK
jgi:hypothetical protein